MIKSLVVLNDCMFSDAQIKYIKNNFTDVEIYHDTDSEELAIKRIKNKNIIILDQFMFSFGEKLLKKCTGSQSEDAYTNLTETIIEAAVSFAAGKPMYLIN